MTTCFIKTNDSGAILAVAYNQLSNDFHVADDQDAAVAKFLRDPFGLADAFPALKKWQLWLAALELPTPITKADVLAQVDTMGLTAIQKETIRIMVEDAQEYAREDPRIDLLAQAMGIPPEQMDALWIWAASFSSM
jgi:hypothetical protein